MSRTLLLFASRRWFLNQRDPRQLFRQLSTARSVTWDQLASSVMRREPLPFSQVIDVRTAAEFGEDHIPGAINLPILSNQERKSVGATYADSSFEGRRLGAGLLCKNLGAHLDNFFADKDADFAPLIYCARGGLRSHGVAAVLEAIGFNVTVLVGGYRAYRSWIRQELDRLPKLFQFRVITGCTGSAKSRLLDCLAASGQQVLHLEALANHKGSVLGLYPGRQQPSQRNFDAALVAAMWRFSAERPVWLEDESRSIGACHLSQALWEAKAAAPHFRIDCPREVRAEFILADYDYFTIDKETLKTCLSWLAKVQSAKRIEHWMDLIDQGSFRELVLDLLEHHYDPLYHRSRAKTFENPLTVVVTVGPDSSLLNEDFLSRVVVTELIEKAQDSAARQQNRRKNCDG